MYGYRDIVEEGGTKNYMKTNPIKGSLGTSSKKVFTLFEFVFKRLFVAEKLPLCLGSDFFINKTNFARGEKQ